jgi:YD repeat-containing protein
LNRRSGSQGPARDTKKRGRVDPTPFLPRLLDRLVSETGPLLRTTTYGYDARGQLTRVTDPNANTTFYVYGPRGQQTKTTDAESGVIDFTYDADLRVTSLRDPVGNTTTWAYDSAGRIATRTDPLGTITYGFDAADRLTQITDRRGWLREFAYDAADRLTSETWACPATPTSPPCFGSGRTITDTYNDANELTGVSDPDSTYAFTYTPAGLLDTIDNAGTPNVPKVVLDYAYDLAGRLTRRDDAWQGMSPSLQGYAIYSYDNANRLTRIEAGTRNAGDTADVPSKRIDFAYNRRGQTTDLDRSRLSGGTVTLVTQADYVYAGARKDDSSPRRFAACCCQTLVPKGVPRFTDRRNACNSASVSGPFTKSTHFDPRGTGHVSRGTLRLFWTLPEAGPPPIFGLPHEIGTQRIPFDVATKANARTRAATCSRASSSTFSNAA